MAKFLVLLALVASASALTTEKCAPSGKDSQDQCFKAALSSITVNIGADGTDDDVTMEICSDKDVLDCCTTPPLKSLLSDDFSSGDTEKWEEKHFGPCKGKVFKIRRSLFVTLTVAKDDSLAVNSIQVETKTPDTKESVKFNCESFKVGGKDNPSKKATRICRTDAVKATTDRPLAGATTTTSKGGLLSKIIG